MSTRNLGFGLRLALLLGAAALAGCSGGGSGSGGGRPQAQNTTTVGVITGFGSVHVNGVRYRTTNSTEIMMNGAPAAESTLEVGQVVMVKGSLDSDGREGEAHSIHMDAEVTGPVDSVGTDQLVVLGQTVLTDADTVFGRNMTPADLTSVQVGDVLEVSGFRDADGAIVASFIELAEANEPYRVHGTVASLDATASTFMIGDLVVDYSSAQLSDFSSGAPMDGDVVRVKGTSLGAAGELVATRVALATKEGEGEWHEGHEGDDGDVDLQGLVTAFTSSTDFEVAGQAVTTTADTRYVFGTESMLALDVQVEIDGSLDANGVLVARKIEFRGAQGVKISGSVDSVAPDQLVVLGVLIQTDMLTRFRDDSSADVRMFSAADIQAGDYVEVSGTLLDPVTHEVVASKVERENPRTDVRLAGPVDAVGTGTLDLLGLTVTTDGSTLFEDADHQMTDSAGFFSQVAVGDFVRVVGDVTSATTIQATRLGMASGYDHHEHEYEFGYGQH